VNELRAVPREESSAFVTDDPPIADGEEVGSCVDVVDGKVLEDAGDVLRAAAVLDVEEDGPARRRSHGQYHVESVAPFHGPYALPFFKIATSRTLMSGGRPSARRSAMVRSVS